MNELSVRFHHPVLGHLFPPTAAQERVLGVKLRLERAIRNSARESAKSREANLRLWRTLRMEGSHNG